MNEALAERRAAVDLPTNGSAAPHPTEPDGAPGSVHWPGVQGLRGAAVGAVLLYHHNPERVPGGFLGVSLFFTLSGFLITTLLLREQDRQGRVSLSRFWARRARRLMPVALLGLLLAAIAAPFAAVEAELGRIGGDIVAAAFDVANWRFALGGLEYGDAFAAPSPVTHYWSLSIEEQFYAVFPIVVLLAGGRRRLATVLVAVGAASLLAQIAIDQPNRVYLGSDTRASELVVGALLAIWWARRPRLGPRLIDAVALPVGALVVAAWLTVELGSPRLYDGGLFLVALSSAVLVLAAVAGRWAPRLLGWKPLTVVGDHSYALYVFHFPVFLVLSPARVGVGGVALLVIRLAVTSVIALVVHRVVEEPVRVGAALRGWQAKAALAGGMATAVVVALVLPHVPSVADDGGVGALVASGGRRPTVVTTPVRPGEPVPHAPRLLVVGDSTALVNGDAMRDWGSRTGRLTIDIAGAGACTFLNDGLVVYREGWVTGLDGGCLVLRDTAAELVEANAPDAIVLFIGSAQLADWIPTGTDDRVAFGDPDYDARYVEAADEALAQLTSSGIPVLLATVPVPAWVPEETFPAAALQGSGPVTMNDAGRAARLNELTAEVVARHPLVRLVPYAEGIAGADGSVDAELRPDGLHLTPAAIEAALETWLEDELRLAYEDVVAAEDLIAGPTTWAPASD